MSYYNYKAEVIRALSLSGVTPQEVADAARTPVEVLRQLYPNVCNYGPAGDRVVELAAQMQEVIPQLSWKALGVPNVTSTSLHRALVSWRKTLVGDDLTTCSLVEDKVWDDFCEISAYANDSEVGDGAIYTLIGVATMHLFEEADELNKLIETLVDHLT